MVLTTHHFGCIRANLDTKNSGTVSVYIFIRTFFPIRPGQEWGRRKEIMAEVFCFVFKYFVTTIFCESVPDESVSSMITVI